jgi:hypothetical protein
MTHDINNLRITHKSSRIKIRKRIKTISSPNSVLGDLIIRNRVKPICSPTSFGEHNDGRKSNYGLIKLSYE